MFPPGLIAKMGIPHVKGMLLYGPPGTGKTLIARQIGKALNARPPKVINGPEVLNKYVGQSEENIRKLFADAEKEYKEKGERIALELALFMDGFRLKLVFPSLWKLTLVWSVRIPRA